MQQTDSVFLTPEQNKLILQGEIRLLQKQKTDLLEDLDRAERSRKTQVDLHQKAIKTLGIQKETLEGEIATLNRQLEDLVKRLQETSIDSKKYAEDVVKKAEIEREKLVNEGNSRIKAAEDAENNLTSFKNRLEDTEQKQLITANNQKNKDAELVVRETAVIEREIAAKVLYEEAEEKLKQLTHKNSVLESQISQKTAESQRLDGEVRRKQYSLNNLNVEFHNKSIAMDNREKMLNTKTNMVNDKEKALEQKERWLEDREQTLARAREEIIAMGGNVDGE